MESLIQRVQQLVELIAQIGSEARNSQPAMLERYRRQVVDTVHKTPSGDFPERSHYEYVYKPSLHRAQFATAAKVKADSRYAELKLEIQRVFGEKPNIESILGRACDLLTSDYFYGPGRNITEFVENLGRDINDEPVRGWSEVTVRGFEILVPEIVCITTNSVLTFRQPQVSDFEREYADHMNLPEIWDRPSSFVRIETPVKSMNDLQLAARQAEALTRLFDVCSSNFRKQSFRSESVGRLITGETISHSTIIGGNAYQLTADNVGAFKTFWSECAERIPSNFFNFASQGEDYLKIAYDRYCDALFHRGRPEGKVALAVMGMEALFLGSEEKDELKYKLTLRIAKMFSKIGFDHVNLRTCVRTGYDIRSTYVHGGHLTAKQRANAEKKTGLPFDALSRSLLNDLRISILMMVLLNIGKEKMLTLLEDSLLVSSRDQELQSLLASLQHLVTRNLSVVPI